MPRRWRWANSLHAQCKQHPLGRPAHDAGLRPHDPPVGECDGKERGRRDPERRLSILADPLVDAETDQPGPGERREAIEHDEDQTGDERPAEGPEEVAEPERPLERVSRDDVDIGPVHRGRELGHLLQQLGRRRESRAHAPAAHSPHATAAHAPRPGPAGAAAAVAATPTRTGSGGAGQADGVIPVAVGLRGHRYVALDVEWVEVDALDVVTRSGEQVAVHAAAGDQLVVRTLVDHVAVVHDDDAIRELERGAPVRDEDRGAADEDPAQRVVDLRLDPRVDRPRSRRRAGGSAGRSRALGQGRCAGAGRRRASGPARRRSVS